MSQGQLRRIDGQLVLLLGGIVLFGLLLLLSASGPLAYQRFGSSGYFFTHQLTHGIIPGLMLFLFFAFIDYRKLRPWAAFGLILSILLLLLVYIPGLGLKFGGADRWVQLGFIAFQPSEFVKVSFCLYVAAWLAARHEDRAKTLQEGLIPFVLSLGIVMGLLILQPNTGSMSVITGMALVMYFTAGAPLQWFVGIGVLGAGLITLLIKLTPYRAARFMTFLHPELDPQGIGYHINQAFLAIGSGGLFGLGYGHSRQKFLYLPEVAGDSIFAIIAEEMGFVVTVGLLIALGALVYRCWQIGRTAGDDFGQFLAIGVGAWIAIQSIFNVSSMLGLMPMTGVTLPFMSYGSSSFIALAIALGIVASVSKYSRHTI